jgi:16S rRNA (cytosine1402-N4)-methyltransferase
VLRHGDFRDLGRILAELGIDLVDGILFDLGVSSYQLDTPARGFSYRFEGPLDMRMDTSLPTTAEKIIAQSSEGELALLLHTLGEERHARRIAAAIVRARQRGPIRTTTQLAAIIREAVRGPYQVKTLSRCFQALRMAVNREDEALSQALEQVPGLLRPGGRVVVLSYESITDRITKTFFAREERGCICPPSAPVCGCRRKPTMRVLTRRPIVPSAEERRRNVRSRGAKLRVAERLP